MLVVPFANSIIYINRTSVDNSAVSNVTIDYYHDTTGCVVNATFVTFVPITKLTLYFKIKIAEDQFDKDFQKALVSTVFEVDKVLKGMQSNMFISGYFAAIKNSMDFVYRMPLPPVSRHKKTNAEDIEWFFRSQGTYRFLNLKFDAQVFQILPESSGTTDLRIVGKIKGSNKNKFLAHIAFYGGVRDGFVHKYETVKSILKTGHKISLLGIHLNQQWVS